MKVGTTSTATAILNGNLTQLPNGTTASWQGSDPTIATVTQRADNPLAADVAVLAPGTFSITCTVVDHNAGVQSVSGTTTFTVEPAPVPITSVTVQVLN